MWLVTSFLSPASYPIWKSARVCIGLHRSVLISTYRLRLALVLTFKTCATCEPPASPFRSIRGQTWICPFRPTDTLPGQGPEKRLLHQAPTCFHLVLSLSFHMSSSRLTLTCQQSSISIHEPMHDSTIVAIRVETRWQEGALLRYLRVWKTSRRQVGIEIIVKTHQSEQSEQSDPTCPGIFPCSPNTWQRTFNQVAFLHLH